MLRDIAVQKAAEEQINRQAVALAAAASAILITDRDGRITWLIHRFAAPLATLPKRSSV
jgi:PAS domain-containing protein